MSTITPTASISVVLPVQSGAAVDPGRPRDLDAKLGSYIELLEQTGAQWELLLVSDHAAESVEACARNAARDERITNCPPTDGWGAAVRAGLHASSGELLCYAYYERTSAATLSRMLAFAMHNPSLVVRANRRTRATLSQRVGSLVFNLECRAMLGVSTWDVNGTPKLFPRAFAALLELRSDDDLLDAEFSAVCERFAYQTVELPADAPTPAERLASPSYRSALRMYLGVPRLARALRAA